MHATYNVTKYHNNEVNQSPRKIFVHFSVSASQKNSGQVLATATNSGSDRNKFLSSQNKTMPTVTGRVEVVKGEFTSKRQTSENRNAIVNHPNRCFQNSLGAVCQGTTMRGTWSYQE